MAKFKLVSEKPYEGRAYGLKFDADGVCECDEKVAQSLVDAGKIEAVKPAPAKSQSAKK